MNSFYFIILIIILVFYAIKMFIIYKKNQNIKNAGKKWDNIVKELSKRK